MLTFVLERGGEEDGVEGPLRPSELTREGEGNLHTCSGTHPSPNTSFCPWGLSRESRGRVVRMVVGRERNFPLTATTIETASGKDTTLSLPSAFTPVISGF